MTDGQGRRLTEADRARVAGIIAAQHGRLSAITGFLGAQPGFPIVGGRLVREPAIIVYVDRKLPETHLLPEELAPSDLGGLRVDVVQPDPWTQLELSEATQPLLADFDVTDAPVRRYQGLPGDPIDQVFEVANPILCNASPDAGWVVLRDFLQETRERLTVAIYDFSAEYLATTLVKTARANALDVALTIDDDRKPAEHGIQERLESNLGDRYTSAVIYCRGNMRFPSAYHPKVAVQDGRRFWLSSGNWSRSSQPEIDPVGAPESAAGMYSRANRDWHVIVDDRPLADLFERYILHDKQAADEDAAQGLMLADVPMPDLFVPLDGLLALADEMFAEPVRPVAPRLLPAAPAPFPVRPLLSPDNYARRVSEWIRGADQSLYLQYSYINYSVLPHDQGLRDIVDYLIELSWRDDFDLRIITNRSREKARKLADAGLNEAKLRLQSGVHNKGVVRDGRQVLVSSQNWSGDGFLRNRDAGLIIDQPEIAAYYRDLFLDDWEARADDPFATPELAATIAPMGRATPPGMVRMSWQDYFRE